MKKRKWTFKGWVCGGCIDLRAVEQFDPPDVDRIPIILWPKKSKVECKASRGKEATKVKVIVMEE
jgi:hypothetical protein